MSKNTQMLNVKKDKNSPALGLLFAFPATTQDINTRKTGFKYSDGWIVSHFGENHRTAPFPKSVPKIGMSASAITTKKKLTIPNLRTNDKLVVDKNKIEAKEITP